MPYRTDGGVLWLQLESDTGTPTYAAATNIKLKLFIETV
jgi:hypothetical protein